jgi:hypothetical protein
MRYWTPSPIYFDPTGTLLSRRSIPPFLFIAGLSIREMKEWTKRFFNDMNSKKLKSVEDSERSSADSRSRKDRKEGNTNLTVPDSFCMRKLMFVEQLEPLYYLLGIVHVSGSR